MTSAARRKSAAKATKVVIPVDSEAKLDSIYDLRWPVKGPEPLPGSILPGKRIVAWDVGYGFRPNDVVEQEVRRLLLASTAEGRPLLMAEHFDASTAWSFVLVNPTQPREVDVTICSLDRPEDLLPETHTWIASKLSWIKLADGLPQYARGYPKRKK